MQTIIDVMREFIGVPDFYKVLSGNNPTWDYGSMIEYFVASLILLITISSVFKILSKLIDRR